MVVITPTVCYSYGTVTSDIRQWQGRSACLGADPDLFFAEKTKTLTEGRKVCATCPVSSDCLQHALAAREKVGLWGGASERERRSMRVRYLQRTHDYRPGCDDPGCRWCRRVEAHLDALRTPQGPRQLNGPGARCGKKSTYNRGCRCGPCALSRTSQGPRLEALGWDLAAWWASWFGENDARMLLGRAKTLAECDIADQAQSTAA